MSNLVCKNCKSISVEYEDYCGGTSYYRCKTCGQWGDKDKFTQQTVFHRIMTSPDVLAEKLVYDWGHLCYNGDVKIYWKSTILPDAVFYSKSEAIAATLEELNKASK